ncbi:CPBP family intramembrane glutamic endopeptidase [Bacillus sp. OV322]|uniref:CPBP family intramembrane glutamic endopeptidase n=1 Tax=Bacillus sp. OV322 TaxID=1882764 RepID=UPI0015A6A44B|nr:type II CAAX endopeptidase family protein [Bacillus sp. OV322]
MEETKIKSITYISILIVFGYLINNLSHISAQLGDYETLLWLITFLLFTFSFSGIRQIITPLINIKFIKRPSSYFYILITLTIPYLLLLLCVHYEILLDETFIFYYKHGLLKGVSIGGIVDAAFLAPIWEEVFFRGVLLFFLLKFTKPVWAISLSSVLFALFHPMYWIITLVSGVLLSITTYKTRSLIPSVISHSLWNLYMAKLFLYFSLTYEGTPI